MAEADLDGVIRSMARKQIKTLADAAKKRHGRLMGQAAKAKDKAGKDRYKHLARNTLLLAAAAARRLEITAENAADSYARSMRRLVEEQAAAEQAAKANRRSPRKS
ncbi:MAG TPA: hypothetical protein VMF90_09430 [Rhizobiaceae bacterium]|nr:hypothetical protein [Rhizobiaceae bacterium]